MSQIEIENIVSSPGGYIGGDCGSRGMKTCASTGPGFCYELKDPCPDINPTNQLLLKLIKKFLPTLKKHNIKIYGTENKQPQMILVYILLNLSAKQNKENIDTSDYITIVNNYTDLPDTTVENPQYYLPKADYSFFLKFNGQGLDSNNKDTLLYNFNEADQDIINYLNHFYKKIDKYDGLSQSTIALIILLSILIILVVIIIIVSATNNK